MAIWQTKNPNQELEDLKRGCANGRMPFEASAWVNLAFFLGQQYTQWDQDTSSLQALKPADEMAPRPVINKIMHFVRTAHHDAMQDRPFPDVLPATDDYQDISDSLVAKAWCEFKAGASQANYDAKLSRAVEWAIIAGTGYLKWSWNPSTKSPQISAPSFFEIYLDPYARTFDDVRYVVHSQWMDPEQVYDLFDVDVKSESIQEADAMRTQLIRGMGAHPNVKGVIVNELWMKPCRRYPRGRYAVWTGRTVLVAPDDLPYQHLIDEKMLPFTCIGTVQRPDTAYFASPVTYLVPAQMELNKAHAQELMIRELFANPKWWIDNDLELKADPDGSPGQKLRGTDNSNSGKMPMLIQPTGAPPNNNLEFLEQGMMHIIGQHEVSQAQVPGRVESSKAIELLKEADAGALATVRATINISNDQGWYHMIELQREFGTESEMVLAYSREGVAEVKAFRAGDLKPGYRIRTAMTTGLARSRSARNDMALRLWDSKAIQDPNQLMELLEVPTGNLLQYQQMAIRNARAENATMQDGKTVDANSWDDHALHIREHNYFRMTHEFQALSDEAKKRFEYHVTQHKELQKVQIAEQAELTMIAQGPQGAPGGPVPMEDTPAPTPAPSDNTEGGDE